MKLVDTEIEHDDEAGTGARPPRPEHRRVYTSLFVTFAILVATVGTVYALFPKRDNEILTVAASAHRSGGPFDLKTPTDGEIEAFSLGVMGDKPPFPKGLTALGVRRLSILRKKAVLARYEIEGAEVSFVVIRAWDTPPRKHRRVEKGDKVLSWRKGHWTCIAVGPEPSAKAWAEAVGAR